jgi:hypothetical protein
VRAGGNPGAGRSIAENWRRFEIVNSRHLVFADIRVTARSRPTTSAGQAVCGGKSIPEIAAPVHRKSTGTELRDEFAREEFTESAYGSKAADDKAGAERQARSEQSFLDMESS